MKKLFVLLLVTLLLFAVSCTKEITPNINNEDVIPEPVLSDLEQAKLDIENGEIEKAYELLLTLEGEEAEELLSHFFFKPTSVKSFYHEGGEFEQINEYDSHGNLIKTTYSDGNYSENEYDERDRRTKATYKTGDQTQVLGWIYDDNDNIVELTNTINGALNVKSTFEYDENGNRIKIHTENGDGNTSDWTAEYNQNGDFIKHSYKSLHTQSSTVYEYDAENRLIKQTLTDSDGNTVINEYIYNEEGHVHTITENGKLLEKMTYDKNGNNILSEYSPEFSAGLVREEKEYTENGELKRITRIEVLKNGEEFTQRENYTYDENGRLVKREEISHDGSIYLDVNTYHENGNTASLESLQNGERIFLQLYNEEGLRIRETTPTYDYTYEYDEHGNLLTVTDALSNYRQEYQDYKLYYSPTNFNNEDLH